MDNQAQTDTSITQSSARNIPSEPVNTASSKEKNSQKWILIWVIGLLVVGGGAYLLLNNSVNSYLGVKKTSTPTAVPTVVEEKATPTPASNSLNPNTGNLYTDIKERLDQVIK